MRWLEEEVTRITGKNDQMMKENLLLRHVLEEQAGKINELLRREEERAKKAEQNQIKAEPESSPKKKKALWRPGLDHESESKSTKPVPSINSLSVSSMTNNSSSTGCHAVGQNVGAGSVSMNPLLTPTISQSSTTPQVSSVSDNLVHMRLNMPGAQSASALPTGTSLPYAAMIEQVN